jgi:MFS family permease
MSKPHRLLVPALSLTLITSWGSLYYAFAVLNGPILAELQWRSSETVGAFSLALLVWGLCAYPTGRIVDRHGGRHLMTLGSCLSAALLLLLSHTTSIWLFYVVWIGLGAAMSMTLYEPAFAVIVAAYPSGYRKWISVLTLTGGLASTVFWPLTHLLVTHLGWRTAVLVLGLIQIVVCAPLHWFVLPSDSTMATHQVTAQNSASETRREAAPGRTGLLRAPAFWLMAFCFMAFGFVTSAMAVHVIPLLESRGAAPATAIAIAALIGPMQVSGRFAELLLGGRVPTLIVGAFTVSLIPVALIGLLVSSSSAGLLYMFIAIYGAGLGLLTIVRATMPVEIFGHAGYASISGALGAPSVIARAAGPSAATAVLAASNKYDAVLGLMLIVALVGALCYWLTTKKNGR